MFKSLLVDGWYGLYGVILCHTIQYIGDHHKPLQLGTPIIYFGLKWSKRFQARDQHSFRQSEGTKQDVVGGHLSHSMGTCHLWIIVKQPFQIRDATPIQPRVACPPVTLDNIDMDNSWFPILETIYIQIDVSISTYVGRLQDKLRPLFWLHVFLEPQPAWSNDPHFNNQWGI